MNRVIDGGRDLFFWNIDVDILYASDETIGEGHTHITCGDVGKLLVHKHVDAPIARDSGLKLLGFGNGMNTFVLDHKLQPLGMILVEENEGKVFRGKAFAQGCLELSMKLCKFWW
jgi:hypothetical protein